MLVPGDGGLINFTEILLSDFIFGWGVGWILPNIISLLLRGLLKMNLILRNIIVFSFLTLKKLLKIVKTYQQNLYIVVYCVILYVFEDKLVNSFVS